MSVDFKKIIKDLSCLVDALKTRCSIAEEKLKQKEKEIDELNVELQKRKAEIEELTSSYESLKMGMATANASAKSGEELSRLKDKYLALVREIDDCIRLMQHGR